MYSQPAQANPDTYNSVVACGSTATLCIPLVISDVSKGVIANDVNVYGVAASSPPTNGTLTCTVVPGSPVEGLCANGTFTYTPKRIGERQTPSPIAPTVRLRAPCAAVHHGDPRRVDAYRNPQRERLTYTAKMATFLKIPSPGVLSVDSDPNNLPLQVARFQCYSHQG